MKWQSKEWGHKVTERDDSDKGEILPKKMEEEIDAGGGGHADGPVNQKERAASEAGWWKTRYNTPRDISAGSVEKEWPSLCPSILPRDG